MTDRAALLARLDSFANAWKGTVGGKAHAQSAASIRELEAERDALREALRMYAIVEVRKGMFCCGMCEREFAGGEGIWHQGKHEEHAPNCLAARSKT